MFGSGVTEKARKKRIEQPFKFTSGSNNDRTPHGSVCCSVERLHNTCRAGFQQDNCLI